jgi:hypothetical protein
MSWIPQADQSDVILALDQREHVRGRDAIHGELVGLPALLVRVDLHEAGFLEHRDELGHLGVGGAWAGVAATSAHRPSPRRHVRTAATTRPVPLGC